MFNDRTGATRDFTASFGPEVDAWLRVGRLHLASRASTLWTYFREQRNERSFDVSFAGRARLDLGWLTPHASGWRERTRQRPNLEIDDRVRREETLSGLGAELRLGQKLWIDARRDERTYTFGEGAFGRDVFLSALNRRETETSVTGRVAATPLTTVFLKTAVRQDRFTNAPERNSDSLFVLPMVEFKPLALVFGRASLGFRRFSPVDGVEGFSGLVADISLSYLLRDLTRISVVSRRDVDYSFEDGQPYYVLAGNRVEVVQALGGAWDVTGYGGWTALEYRTRTEASTVVPGRRDRVRIAGFGVGRRIGTEIRVGIDVSHARRWSGLDGRNYAGVRAGGVMTYGF